MESRDTHIHTLPEANPLSRVGSRDRIIQDRKYSAPEPPLGRGGEGGGVGGGGSREEEARNPPPGNSLARRRSEALLSLWRSQRPSAAPARPSEARGESGGRRPAPRPPAAAESPGPAGAGRGGAWERPAGGGGLGARRRAALARPPARPGSRRACGARCLGAGQPRADPLAPRPPVRVRFLFRLSRESAEPAGGWRARPAATPSLPATSGHPARRWRGAGGSPRRAPGGGGGAAPARAGRGRAAGRREGHKGRRQRRRRRRGPAGGPWRRGASRPLMNINRACGLARPGRARRPARVPAPACRRASEAGPSGRDR